MTFHLTPELALAFRRGRIAQDDLIQIVFDHLPAVCPHCRAGLAALVTEDCERPAGLPLLGALDAVLQRYEPEIRLADENANRDLRVLKALPVKERRDKILRAHRRFRGVSFILLLLEEQQRHLHSVPGEAYHWAELAWVSACQSPRIPADLLALSLAQMGNSRRAAGDLRSAEDHFRHVRHLVARHPVTDLVALARIFHLEGSLRKDQREFAKAIKLLDRSVMLYRLRGERREIVQVFMTLADVYFYQGTVHRAISKVRKALSLVDSEMDETLYLWARHNLACYLADDGRYDEAWDLLCEDTPRCRVHFAPVDQLRLSWLEGRIAIGRGEGEVAERILLETRNRFLEEGVGYGAAMVSLDLALYYAREERTDELKRLAEEIAPVFSAHDVHREALAALVLFQEAARRETLTLTSLKAIASYLRDARNDPSLRFEPPSNL